MRSIALAVTLLVAAVAGAAPPGNEPQSDSTAITAGDLQQLCAGSDHVSRNACRIYILGVTQGVEIGLAIGDGTVHGRRPCVPPHISAAALEAALKGRLDAELAASPASRSRDASRFIASMLVRSFPCRAARPRP